MSSTRISALDYRALVVPPPTKGGGPKRSKYGNKITKVGNLTFSSKKEAKRWVELGTLNKAGQISNLRRQVRFSLDVGGVHICDYISDFTYTERKKNIVEDVKGIDKKGGRGNTTPEFKLKAKLMFAIHGITIRIV